MHETENITVAYILESISPGWLSYEIDALRDSGCRIEIYPTNPARYQEFRGLEFPARASTARDITNLASLAIRKPMETPRRLAALRRRVGWRIAASTLSLARRIERTTPFRPGLLHAHFASGPALSALTASHNTTIPFGFTAHAYDIFKEPIDWDLMREKCRAAAFVRCISAFNKAHLMQKTGVSEDRFIVIPCGVDTERFHPNEGEQNKPHGKRTILTAGGLVAPKGIPRLLEAMSDVRLRNMGCRLVIAGDGPEKERLKQLAAKLDIDAEFLGGVANESMPRLYREADLFVIPCVTAADGHHDGIPVALMEAMASGIPVVSSDISGIPELIEDDVSGLLTPEDAIKPLVEAIFRVLTDEDLSVRLARAGRERVRDRFDIRDIARRLEGLFLTHAERDGR
ncbi:MAG: glycosyltransferase family 4 protein [Deltaproteobacteria bacterium]|nr:glycosyltransferase family 4 protein [Candidatus Zymogenaceae bacterium]